MTDRANASPMPAASIIFLHIPKTAGQSIHTLLQHMFGAEQVSSARVNFHLARMTIPQIRRHRIYSGHFDWSLLDCLPEPRFMFTVLRDPMERILSYYFYLRDQASVLSGEERASPLSRGAQAAVEMLPDEYFLSGAPEMRAFLDNHFDNFYAYYFAGRTYDARQRLIDLCSVGCGPDDDEIVAMAIENMGALNGVYSMGQLDQLQADLQRLATGPPVAMNLRQLHENVGDGSSTVQRLERLRKLGATSATFERLESMIRLDRIIWARFAQPTYDPLLAAQGEQVRGSAATNSPEIGDYNNNRGP
jgi:Sulfotransferase family